MQEASQMESPLMEFINDPEILTLRICHCHITVPPGRVNRLGGVNAAVLHSMSKSLLGLHSGRRERRVGSGASSGGLQLSKGRCLVTGNILRASAGGKSRRKSAKVTVKIGRASSRGSLGDRLGRRVVGCERVVRVNRAGGDVGVG